MTTPDFFPKDSLHAFRKDLLLIKPKRIPRIRFGTTDAPPLSYTENFSKVVQYHKEPVDADAGDLQAAWDLGSSRRQLKWSKGKWLSQGNEAFPRRIADSLGTGRFKFCWPAGDITLIKPSFRVAFSYRDSRISYPDTTAGNKDLGEEDEMRTPWEKSSKFR